MSEKRHRFHFKAGCNNHFALHGHVNGIPCNKLRVKSSYAEFYIRNIIEVGFYWTRAKYGNLDIFIIPTHFLMNRLSKTDNIIL